MDFSLNGLLTFGNRAGHVPHRMSLGLRSLALNSLICSVFSQGIQGKATRTWTESNVFISMTQILSTKQDYTMTALLLLQECEVAKQHVHQLQDDIEALQLESAQATMMLCWHRHVSLRLSCQSIVPLK